MTSIVPMVVMAAQILFANARLVYDQLWYLDISGAEFNSRFQDVTENVNWNKCLDINGMSLGRCIYNCEDNEDCEASCVDQFKTRTDDCPCEVGT